MGNYPTLSHIGATYSFMSGNCQQKFQIFRGFLCYFELKMTVNILDAQRSQLQQISNPKFVRPTDPQQKPKNDREYLKFAIGLPAEPKPRWGDSFRKKWS